MAIAVFGGDPVFDVGFIILVPLVLLARNPPFAVALRIPLLAGLAVTTPLSRPRRDRSPWQLRGGFDGDFGSLIGVPCAILAGCRLMDFTHSR